MCIVICVYIYSNYRRVAYCRLMSPTSLNREPHHHQARTPHRTQRPTYHANTSSLRSREVLVLSGACRTKDTTATGTAKFGLKQAKLLRGGMYPITNHSLLLTLAHFPSSSKKKKNKNKNKNIKPPIVYYFSLLPSPIFPPQPPPLQTTFLPWADYKQL